MNVTTTTGGSSTAINFAKSGSFASPAFNAMDVGKTISVAGAGTGGATLITTITAVNSATQIVIATGASTALTGSSQYVSYGTDNTSKIQAAIAQAQTSGLPLRVPSSSAGCFGYAGALTITANVTVVGDALVKSWAGGINAPLATPALTGSVICPTSSGANAITASGITPQINLRNLGVMFQTPFVNTGDGFNLVQALQGLTDPFWENVAFYGHDGNHYAVNLQNPLLGVYNDVESYGGGVLKEYAVNGIGNFGNQVWEHLYGQIVTGGSANGVNLDAATQSNLALLTFIRPQMITDNISSLSGSNPPTSSQQIWNETVNVTNVRKIAPDFESNVGSSFTLAYIFRGDDPDWNSLFTTAPSINMPAWGVNGALFGPQTRVLNDTTSSGAATNTGIFTLTGNTITATSPTTYPVLTTLYIGPPICGTNCTATRLDALYTTGEIFTTSDIGANGFFGTGTTLITGTITLNKNATANTTEICDGTTTGACTIGGASNIVKLGSNVQVTGSAQQILVVAR